MKSGAGGHGGHHHAHGHGHGHSHGLVDPSIKRSRAGLRAVALSLARSGADRSRPAAIFAVTGSVALLADLIHNFGDAATAFPLGDRLPLRSERAERSPACSWSLAIFVSACVAGYEAVGRLIHPQAPTDLAVLAAAGRSASPATRSRR